MREHGVVTRAKGDSILFAPPLVITEDQIDAIVNVTGDAIETVTGSMG
jgi:adenosylmethionine-8-amino-7-oxononanoate aminotransferase